MGVDSFNKKPIGLSGTEISGRIFEAEYLQELTGIRGHEIYNRMRRSDPQIRKILSAISSPIKAAKWFIEPVSDEKRDIEA